MHPLHHKNNNTKQSILMQQQKQPLDALSFSKQTKQLWVLGLLCQRYVLMTEKKSRHHFHQSVHIPSAKMPVNWTQLCMYTDSHLIASNLY
jgi:hypothetical protein